MGRKLNSVEKPENITVNELILPDFIDICKMKQRELKKHLKNELIGAGYENVVSKDGYLYAKGDIPILLTAHMDTVHREVVKTFSEVKKNGKHYLSSIQGIGGDDRCGIYMILQLIKTHKCSILFCEDEEIGGKGGRKILTNVTYMKELKDLKYMIELDRTHEKDAVFYNCDNKEFTKFICSNTGYKESYGSFSDISYLAPSAGIAAVNLSCGYYNAHMTNEYVVIEEMLNTIEVVKKLLDVECEQFKYVRKEYSYGGYRNYNFGDYYGRNWYNGNRGVAFGRTMDVWDDDDEDDYFTTAARKEKKRRASSISNYRKNFDANEYDQMVLYVTYEDPDTLRYEEGKVTGSTKAELWWKFFQDYPNICMNAVQDYNYDYI